MQALKKIIYGFAIVMVLIVVVGLFLPSEFRVERSITVNATPDKVFQHIVDLKQWRNWGVWFERDPNMQITYTGNQSQVGMKSSWISEQEGSGEMTIKAIKPNEKVVYDLYFPDFDMGSTGELTLVREGDKTNVIWADYGDVGGNPINHYFAVMMDGMIGPDFEAGLANLKALVEQ